LPFIPLSIELARRLKVDNIFAVAVLALGAYGGFMASPISTFSTAVAQEIADIPTFSGAGFRTILTIILLATMAAYTTWYAARVRKDPSNSVMDKIDFSNIEVAEFNEDRLSVRQALSLVIFFSGFILFSICATKFSFGSTQLAGIMLPVGLACGIVSGFDIGETMNAMVKGAQRQVPSLVVMILAAGVTTILNMSGILDSVVYYISQSLLNFNSVFAAIGMFIANAIINFGIPSGSGQAAAVMPIMAPMADVLGITRQVSVLAYQLGDGFTNLLNPANASLAAGLAIAHTSFKDWLKLVLPVYGIMFVECCVALTLAVLIGW
ncbi:MAG: TIGR00366 family protein, partial [Lawsonibacter sp.]|nr:TIGR00366 family protein [Lawsonibacter sp.]